MDTSNHSLAPIAPSNVGPLHHNLHHHMGYPVPYPTVGPVDNIRNPEPPHMMPHQQEVITSSPPENVLNLSRRVASPYDVSSEAGSGLGSGDDEHDRDQVSADCNNSLPLKLRHKSHLGDKDAATALLALQHIKQEPNLRSSPRSWDGGDGSSDERDSGISICGAPEWTTALQQKLVVVQNQPTPVIMVNKEEENIHLKSQLARLESEVATIKNMMILNTASCVGATAAAQ
jgi:vrille protein